MKKLMAILVFAGVLSVPSAVFAEASWYGSLRVGVETSDSNLSVKDGASRWGIRGSAEAGEGLTAVYRFETKISSNNAESSGGKATVGGTEYSGGPGGRLSYVGLSGAFGSVTLGQVWSASFNAVGAILDKAWYYGNAGTSIRVGNAVSYAFSNDLVALQVDAVYGKPEEKSLASTAGAISESNASVATTRTDNLQQLEFGLSVNISDIGKVAFAHVNDEYFETVTDGSLMNAAETPALVPNHSTWGKKKTVVAAEINVSGLSVYLGAGKVKYENTSPAQTDGDSPSDFAGSTAVRPEEKTTFFGISGSLGDAGLDYVLQWNDVKSSDTNPWVLSLTKSLGDSASLVLEHGNNDDPEKKPNQTQLGLVVNF